MLQGAGDIASRHGGAGGTPGGKPTAAAAQSSVKGHASRDVCSWGREGGDLPRPLNTNLEQSKRIMLSYLAAKNTARTCG